MHPVQATPADATPVAKPRLGYIAFYANKRLEIYADSLLDAKQQAIAHFKAPKSKSWMLSVMLAEIDGEAVVHVAVD